MAKHMMIGNAALSIPRGFDFILPGILRAVFPTAGILLSNMCYPKRQDEGD
jgi:hypothetical protein